MAVTAALTARAAGRVPAENLPPNCGRPVPRGDVRDRLLAVLLDDPALAVGAAADLEECRGQLERLTDAVRHERVALRGVLVRLAESGLRTDQLARLSGLSLDEVTELVEPAPRR